MFLKLLLRAIQKVRTREMPNFRTPPPLYAKIHEEFFENV